MLLSVASIGEALAHTYAVGLRAGDEGGVDVWFRMWHNCSEAPQKEGSIKIEGVNGTVYPVTYGEVQMSSCMGPYSGDSVMPTWALSTDVGYYCEINAQNQILDSGTTGAIRTDAAISLGFNTPDTGVNWEKMGGTYSAGAVLCNTSIYRNVSSTDMWFGANFVGLSPGDYRVTYLECNNPENPTECKAKENAPSDNFTIKHKLIASVVLEVTPELAGVPPPTVVPDDNSLIVSYYAPDSDEVVDHYQYDLNEQNSWVDVTPLDALEAVSSGTLTVSQSTLTRPAAGAAHFNSLTDTSLSAVYLNNNYGSGTIDWSAQFAVGERIGFEQGNVLIDGRITSKSSSDGVSGFTLDKTQKVGSKSFVAGQSISVGRLLPYGETPRTFTISGLNNEQDYSVRVRAVYADGSAGDPSAPSENTPRPNCNDPNTPDNANCLVDGAPYDPSDDVHVLSLANGAPTDVCGTGDDFSGHRLPAGNVIFCEQSAGVVRAIFNWDNGQAEAPLDWLASVTQVGSRTEDDSECVTKTLAGRCSGQLASGYRAFMSMAGAGGDAIKNLDISNLTDIREMFKDAATFNADLSAWDIKGVATDAGFDEGADQWCGLGFSNQGRPIGLDATAEDCLDLNMTSVPSKIVETNDQLLYSVEALNQTTTSIDTGTLTLLLPTGTQYNAGDSPTPADTVSGQTLTWNNISLLEGQLGAERAIAIDVPSSFSGASVTASATLTDTASGATVNKLLKTKVGGAPEPLLTMTGPTFVLAGDSLVYDLSFSNFGNRDAQSMAVSLTWDSDTAVVADSSSADICSGVPLTCEWTVTVPAGEAWFTRVMVQVPADTPMPLTLEASAKAAASGMRTAIARARTVVDAQPELTVRLKTQPDATVEPSGTIVTETIFENTGTAAASDVTVSLPLAGTTLQQASAGGSESGGNVVWSLGNVLPGATASILTATLQAPDPAPDPAQLVQTAARVTASTPGGRPISEESAAVALAVTSKPTPELEMAFAPEHYTLEGPIDLVFTYRNDSPSEISGAKLTMRIPQDTNLTATPDGATCYSDRCEKTIDRMASGFEASTVMSLEVNPDARFSIAGGGLLSPTVQNEFVFQTATAEAYARQDTGISDDFTMNLAPEAGSGCTLASMESVTSTPLAGYTTLTDDFLSFTVTGCDLNGSESFTVQVDAGEALPGGALLVKVDEDDGSVSPIEGAEIDGSIATYTLADQGELDQDLTPGTLRDPVAFVLRNAGPVPLPLWLVGFGAVLLGWLGYRRLRAA